MNGTTNSAKKGSTNKDYWAQNKKLYIEKTFSRCQDLIKPKEDEKEIQARNLGWSNWNNSNVFFWLDKDETIREMIKGFIIKCLEDTDSVEHALNHAVDLVEVYLIVLGFATTPGGALVTYDSLQEVVGHYAYGFARD